MEYRPFFLFIVIVLFGANLLVMNGQLGIWEGAESLLVWQVLHGAIGITPHEWLAHWGAQDSALFWTRFPGAVVLALGVALGCWIGRPILGKQTTWGTFCLIAGSLLVANLAKVASGDSYALAFHWCTLMLLLRYLKQPQLRWQLLFYAGLLFSVWVQPLSSLLLLLGLSTYLYFLHPQGKRLWQLNPWVAGVAIFVPFYFLGWATLDGHSFLVGWDTLRFLGWNAIGALPFVGFAMAGLWEATRQARKGEELSLILLGAVGVALLSHSLALQALLALVAARQLHRYFQPNYPYRNIVRGFAVLHLIGAVFLAIGLMLGAFAQFKMIGFRGMLTSAAVYWMWSLIAVIGLYGLNERYARTGTIMAGLVAITLFWLQAAPVLETQRSWSIDLVKRAAKEKPYDLDAGAVRCFVWHPDGEPIPPLAVYAKASFPQTILLNTELQVNEALRRERQGNALFLLPIEGHDPIGFELNNTEIVEEARWVESSIGWSWEWR